MEEIKESMAQLEQMFLSKMEDFQSQIPQKPSTTVAALAADFSNFRATILATLQCLQNQVLLLTRNADNMEMASRKKFLLFHGLPESKGEDVALVVVDTVVSKLKVEQFSIDSISRCHRMGRSSSEDRPRPVLVKIRDMSVRTKMWNAKASLKGSGITMSEFLTKPRHDLFMAARQKFGVAKTWTREGTVYVLTPDGARHRVTSMTELEDISEATSGKNSKIAGIAGKAVKEAGPAPKGKGPTAGGSRK